MHLCLTCGNWSISWWKMNALWLISRNIESPVSFLDGFCTIIFLSSSSRCKAAGIIIISMDSPPSRTVGAGVHFQCVLGSTTLLRDTLLFWFPLLYDYSIGFLFLFLFFSSIMIDLIDVKSVQLSCLGLRSWQYGVYYRVENRRSAYINLPNSGHTG